MKHELLQFTAVEVATLTSLYKATKSYSGAQVQSNSLLSQARKAATQWFDEIRPALRKANFSTALIDEASSQFETLLRFSKMKPRKTALLNQVDALLSLFRDKIIHQIEVGSFSDDTGLSIAPFVEGLSSDEGEYLDEAQRCLSAKALRGCIVLGWCATISRIQTKIEDIGYNAFSKASEEMFERATGRFKPFKKKFQIDSRTELQRVFDTDLLWVLEYMQLIDGNQHERLRHCFEFRNNSAHPGLAPIKAPNLYSFYSDISEIVLKNPKFAIDRRGPSNE